MADRIYIRTGDMPTGSLKKGKNKVDDVVSTLLPLTHQRGNPLDSIYYVMNGEYHRLFSDGAATLVANCCAEMQNLQLQIETYLAILNSGPSEFEQIDRAAKNSLTTWADRTNHAIGGAFSPITSFIGGTLSYLFLPKGLTGFFMTLPSSSGQKQKNAQESTKQNSSERTLPGWAPGAGVISIHPEGNTRDREVCEVPTDKISDNPNASVAGGLGGAIKAAQDIADSNSNQQLSRDVVRIGQSKNAGKSYNSELWGKYDNMAARCNVSCALMAMQQLLGEKKLTETLGSTAWGEVVMDYNAKYIQDNNKKGHDAAWIGSYSGVASLAGLKASTSSVGSIDTLIRKYQENPDIYSAPIAGVQYGKGTHYVMVVGTNPDGTYQIVDPAGWNQVALRHTTDSSQYSTKNNGVFTGKIGQVIQYYKAT